MCIYVFILLDAQKIVNILSFRILIVSKINSLRSLKNKISSSGSFDEEGEYAGMRYNPPMKTILNELVSGQLSTQDYPSVIPMPMSATSTSVTSSARRRSKGPDSSARKKAGATDKWSKLGDSTTKSAGSGSHFVGGRNMIFMVGGLSYPELRVAREIMEKESREIIVGSNKFISPGEFLEDLKCLAA
jgi:syntaxin-binding protein 1